MSQYTRSNDTQWIPYAALGAIALGAYVVWQFSELARLDMNTGAAVLSGFLVVSLATAFCWKFGDDFPVLRLGNVWPVLLGALWMCWWPALDFWATKAYPDFYRPSSVVWWSAWYTKLGGLLLLIGGGYGLKAVFRR